MKYGFEWTPGLALLGVALVLPLVPSFALIALVVVALAAVAALAALAGVMLAMPYLLVRSLRRRRADRRRSREGSVPIASVITRTGRAASQQRLASQAGVLADARAPRVREPRCIAHPPRARKVVER